MTIRELQELLDGYPANATIVFRDDENTEDNLSITETELRIEKGKNYVIMHLDLDMEVLI